MPLFTFVCEKCDVKQEKFLHKLTEGDKILCEKCGGLCKRLFSICGTDVVLDARDELAQNILPDAKRIMKNMENGKDADFSDIYGDN